MPTCIPSACCKCKQPAVLKACYKQPKVAESYAPYRAYVKPTAPVEGYSTYKMSYLPISCGDTRSAPVRPVQSIVVSCEPMQDATVQQLSYQANPICVTQPAQPRNHQMFGFGPMSAVSTQRHDYVPKPIDLRDSFRPDTKYHQVEAPFENRTVNKLSFLPPGRVPRPVSYAPVRCYDPPCTPLDGNTTQKMSYQPNKVQPTVAPPWASKGQYVPPVQRIEGHSVYKMSYQGTQSDCRRLPIVPPTADNPVSGSKGFETETIYRASYLPARACIPAPILPVGSICVATAPMDGDTVQKLSYLPNAVCVTQPAVPRNHQMFGSGPIAAVTTQKHDFVPKPIDLRESFRPDTKYHAVEAPFENRTVNRLSFLNPGRMPPTASYRPVRSYEKSNVPIENATVQKMSYQPVQPQPLMAPPWAFKGQYVTPSCRMEGNTVYRSSFMPPGEDCSEFEDPCKLAHCKPAACNCAAEVVPSTTTPTDSCACRYPKAECCA